MAATYAAARAPAEPMPLSGGALILAGFCWPWANFMVVLDMTIANVSVPNIAGSLAVAPNQGNLGHHLLFGSLKRSSCR